MLASPTQAVAFFTGELLPVPFSATPVIAAKKFWFYRSTDLVSGCWPSTVANRGSCRFCRSNNDQVRLLLLISL